MRITLRERAFDVLLPLLSSHAGSPAGAVIVDVDRDALARVGSWPWPRGRLAEVVAAAAAGKPAALGLDMLLAGQDRLSTDGDAELARALSEVPTVLGFVLDDIKSGQDIPATPILSRAPVSLPNVWQTKGIIGPVPALARAAQGFGALVASADADGPIRRIPLLVVAGEVMRPGFAVELFRLAQNAELF